MLCFILCLHQQACNPSHPASLLPLPHLLCVHHLQHLPVGQSSSPQLRYSCLILRRRDLKDNSGTSIHQLEISRELRAASTFSTHSFSDSTLSAVHSSFARHSCLSWEQGSAPHDLEAQLAESEEEQEEQEERQTEEQGAVVQVEIHEERAFRQQDAQNHLPRDKKEDITLMPIHMSSSSVPRSSSRTSLLVISTSRSRTFWDLVFFKTQPVRNT